MSFQGAFHVLRCDKIRVDFAINPNFVQGIIGEHGGEQKIFLRLRVKKFPQRRGGFGERVRADYDVGAKFFQQTRERQIHQRGT